MDLRQPLARVSRFCPSCLPQSPTRLGPRLHQREENAEPHAMASPGRRHKHGAGKVQEVRCFREQHARALNPEEQLVAREGLRSHRGAPGSPPMLLISLVVPGAPKVRPEWITRSRAARRDGAAALARACRAPRRSTARTRRSRHAPASGRAGIRLTAAPATPGRRRPPPHRARRAPAPTRRRPAALRRRLPEHGPRPRTGPAGGPAGLPR